MDDVTSGSQEDEAAGNTSNGVNPSAALQSIEQPELKAPQPEKNKNAADAKKPNLVERIWQWCVLKEEKTGLHDWFIVLFTFVLTLVAVFQGFILFQNSKSSTAQMSRVIDTANRIDDAADSFSKSSADVSRGVADAVGQLGAQAKASKDQLDAFRRATNDASQTQILIGLPVIIFPGNSLAIRDKGDGTKEVVSLQVLRNVGETRAVGPKVAWGWGRNRPTLTTQFQWHTDIWKSSTWVKDANVEAIGSFTSEQLIAVSQVRPLFLYGRVTYGDIFPINATHKRNDHLVEFCIRIISTNIHPPASASWRGEEIPGGYCYDEKCPNYNLQKRR